MSKILSNGRHCQGVLSGDKFNDCMNMTVVVGMWWKRISQEFGQKRGINSIKVAFYVSTMLSKWCEGIICLGELSQYLRQAMLWKWNRYVKLGDMSSLLVWCFSNWLRRRKFECMKLTCLVTGIYFRTSDSVVYLSLLIALYKTLNFYTLLLECSI